MSVTRADIATYWRETREPIKHYRRLVKSGDFDEAIKVSLDIIKLTTSLITETKKSRQALGDDYTDKVLDNLNAAIEARIIGIIALVNDKDPNYSKGALTTRIKEAAGSYSLPKRVFKTAALQAEKKHSKSLKAIALQGENTTVEFKKSFSEKEKITITLTAFANTNGGSVYIGIAEKKDISESEKAIELDAYYSAIGTPRDIDTNSQKLISFMSAHSNLLIKELKFKVIEYKGKDILKITVPARFSRSGEMSFYKNDAYVCDHNANRKLNSKEIFEVAKLHLEKVAKLTKPILTHEDIRRISISDKDEVLKAKAFYSNGGMVPDFKGYWYGWQLIDGKAPVWTPLGYGKAEINKPQNFTEIHVYKYEYENNPDGKLNTHGTWKPQE